MALVLTNADIISALPYLAHIYAKAQGGSVTTLISDEFLNLNDDVAGAAITFLNGDNVGVTEPITLVTDSTVTFAAVTTAIDASTTYGVIFESFDSFVTRAYDVIKNSFRNMGKDLDLFLTVAQIKELHLLKTLELICLSKRRDAIDTDINHMNYLEFKGQYEIEVTTLKADYDYNEDGVIDGDDEALANTGQVVLSK